jgi:hypothetical protein
MGLVSHPSCPSSGSTMRSVSEADDMAFTEWAVAVLVVVLAQGALDWANMELCGANMMELWVNPKFTEVDGLVETCIGTDVCLSLLPTSSARGRGTESTKTDLRTTHKYKQRPRIQNQAVTEIQQKKQTRKS